MKFVSLLCFTVLMFSACDSREQKLRKKELELQQKEQELLLKEKELQLKEQELSNLGGRSDTLSAITDSIPNNLELVGTWAVKMACIETDCEGSTLGDTKNEHWELSYRGNTILARAKANNKLVRVYAGEYKGSGIELLAEQNAAETTTEAKIFVKLKPISPSRMEGRREIYREGCRIIYALELTK